MCHGNSVTTLADVLLALLAVESCIDLVVYDAVSTQQGPEEHQPAQARSDHTNCDTDLDCCCPGHKAEGNPEQIHPGPVLAKIRLCIYSCFESKVDWEPGQGPTGSV